MEFGWKIPKLDEPLTVIREYEFQWVRPGIDLAELAKLRFNEGWSIERLILHFRVGQGTIYRELTRLQEEQNNG